VLNLSANKEYSIVGCACSIITIHLTQPLIVCIKL
jgi:hypothetical protein